MELLLKQEKIDVNQAMNDGATPLTIALDNGHLNVIDLLLKHEKINYNKAGNEYGHTPLMIASREEFPNIVRSLLSNGADSILTLGDGVTALHIAELYNQSEVVEILKSHELQNPPPLPPTS